MNDSYKQCARCILDTNDDPKLKLDQDGICNYCLDYEIAEKTSVFKGREGEVKLHEIVDQIKKTGKGKKYDCIIGLSGGVDSTYLAYLAHKLGLHPLAVHFDNGWNSELAVKNIENIVKKLGLELYTYVVDWEEFRDVQLSYLKASVIDIEAVTDHAILGTVYRLAKQYNIKYILSGTNVVTEDVLPSHWIFNKVDHVNLKAIHAKYGKVKLKAFPLFDTKLKKYCNNIMKIRSVSLLNYVPFIKKDVKKLIAEELAWRDYGGKHYESIFTRFYQGYILPHKFKVDKRKAHLSNLICSGQITREEAFEEMKKPVYDPEQLKIDMDFVLKKLGLTPQEFEQIMKVPTRSHYDFPTEVSLYMRYPFLKTFKVFADLIGRV